MSLFLNRKPTATLLSVLIVCGLCIFKTSVNAVTTKPNVLFIAVDDLNHWVGYTGRNPQTKTPNIDRLSKMGVSFVYADCAAPLCNPSRAALMSGLRPSSTGCYQNGQNWKKFIPEGRGLTPTFKQAGYFVAGAGKIYHGNTFYPSEWDDYFTGSGGEEDDHGKGVKKMEGFTEPVKHDLKDQDLPDWHITDYCIAQLGKKHDRPFFLACGLHKPHLPWAVPRKYYELFPVEKIQLPPYREDDLSDVPAAGVRMAKPGGDHKTILESDRWKPAIQSYLASIAYTDMNIGRLLDALEKSPHRDNTIIVFWGDHGWHLGEKNHWRKFALWEEAVRAPLIWVVPGVTKAGTLCERPVDFMSIYPTLCELMGFAVPKHVEGVSIKSLLVDPKAPWNTPTLCTFGYQNHSVRNAQWRYIRYANGGEELYDHIKDPYEWTNLAVKEEFKSVRAEMGGWLPKTNVRESSAAIDDEDPPTGKQPKKRSAKRKTSP
jgi:arylsulfatase A-like enzyme